MNTRMKDYKILDKRVLCSPLKREVAKYSYKELDMDER